MTRGDAYAAVLERLNPDALFLEPRSVYDSAIIGITNDPQDHWERGSRTWVAVYSRALATQAIARWLGCTVDTASRWFDRTAAGHWIGPATPVLTD